MPKYTDKRPNIKVSPFEKSQDKEVCINCGTLIDLGARCPVCQVTQLEYMDRFTKFKTAE